MTNESIALTASNLPEGQPRYEVAAALQAVMSEVTDRPFDLDVQQSEACFAIGEALLDGVDSGYIEMATSTGKTVVESLLTEAAVKAGKRVLILAPKTLIARQLHGIPEEADDTTSGIEKFTSLNQTAHVQPHFAQKRANRSADVVISTYSGFLNEYKKGHEKLGEFDVLIADECHHSLGAAVSVALKHSYPNAFKIGFSATPDYAADRTSAEVFEGQLFEFSLTDAVEANRTAPVRALVYETDDTLRLDDPRKEFTDRELAPLTNSLQRNGTALELAAAFVADGRQGYMACLPGGQNAHARYMADLQKRKGLRASAIGAHLSPDENRARINLYNRGGLDVLTFTRGLDEGIHSPRTSFLINLCPTSSPVRTKQLLGRILSKKPDGLESVYVDFVDEKEGIAKTQYTAMHALGLEYIDFTRVVGEPTHEHGRRSTEAPNLLSYVTETLYNRLLSSQGKLLSDVTVGKAENPLFKQWEYRLSQEGMPAEIEYNDVLPLSLLRRVEQAQSEFSEEFGEAAQTSGELLQYIGSVARDRRQALQNYGLRVLFDVDTLTELPNENMVENVLNDPMGENLQGILHWALDTLSEREAGIIALRYGLGDYGPMTLDEIAKVYRITRERVRQIETKTMSKLRHPSRSDSLREYMYAETADTDKKGESHTAIERVLAAQVSPKINIHNRYIRAIRKSFEPVESYEHREWHDKNWQSVMEIKRHFGLWYMSSGEVIGMYEEMEEAIEMFNRRLAHLNDLPTAESNSSLGQRGKTIRVYQSWVDYLQSARDQLVKVEKRLSRH